MSEALELERLSAPLVCDVCKVLQQSQLTNCYSTAQLFCPATSNCGVSCWRVGSPGRAPSAVHLQAATTAPSSIILSGDISVVMPYMTEPMNESPAPVVSATASAGRPAADATNTCATGLLCVLPSAVACTARVRMAAPAAEA